MDKLGNILLALAQKEVVPESAMQKLEVQNKPGLPLQKDGKTIANSKNPKALIYYRSNRERILKIRRSKYSKENSKKAREKFRSDNPEYHSKYMKRWRSKKENRDKILEYMRVYNAKEKNRERENKWRRERYANGKHEEWFKKYSARKKIQLCIQNNKRRIKTANSKDADIQIKHILNLNNPVCFYCGQKIKKGDMHCDHINPIGKNGLHAAFNIVPSCSNCNLSKSSKHPNDFVKKQREYPLATCNRPK